MADISQWHTKWWIGVGAFILAASVQIGSSVWPERIRPHPYLFLFFLLVGAAFIGFGCVHAAWLFYKAHKVDAENISPLEINFEPMNPGKRFWSVKSLDDSGQKTSPFWEHRVEIRNTSLKTLRNVSVTVERTGPMPELPYDGLFDRTKAKTCDIKPGCRELVPVIRWPLQKKQEGMLCGESAWAYGPVVVTASADDVIARQKIYEFNYETNQMLFDKENYSNYVLSKIKT